jgi:hypothetical protein
VLRKTSGPKRQEVTGDGRKLHKDRLHNLYSSPNIIQAIKSKPMRWAGHIHIQERTEKQKWHWPVNINEKRLLR